MSGDYQTDKSKGLVKDFEPTPVNYGNEGVSGAISNKFNQRYKEDIVNIKQLNELDYPRVAMKKNMGAADLANKQYRFDYKQQMAIRQRIMAEESQRAQLMGSLLGLGGAIVGGIVAGPPESAVGGQAGGMVGAGGGTKFGQSPQSGVE